MGGGGVCIFLCEKFNKFYYTQWLKHGHSENLCLEIQKPWSKPFAMFYILRLLLNCDMVATRYENNRCRLICIIWSKATYHWHFKCCMF